MSITVRYFASLREQLGVSEASVPTDGIHCVADVWQRAQPDRDLPPRVLAALNHAHASLEDPVRDGDEVAFFPPVTGG
ncbi:MULTISPECIES: MoaD/ThiS family protein [unclassified Ectothiorhodospira]|uniref:MoaD/ThiS family protein n=1 Tax=unclassified Ectothiorhodospira TaxID=2684909 RepID=UPI001EE800EC|nr:MULTISPECIES: MoaD/ThiS family protein [unclassified Ectothiorhodospira]MCG5515311.1 MoaD/ThiS family protein [Ectothiorhodospira sp. 9100]MCG5519408.1 MoaD/ThiS family protein [Ectothiorhodospira sp. 9905]